LQRDEDLQKLDLWLELAVETVVKETSDQLCGDKHLEVALKKSLAPNKEQNSIAMAALQSAAVEHTSLPAATAMDNNNN